MSFANKMVALGIASAMAVTTAIGVAVITADPIPITLPGTSDNDNGVAAKPIADPEPTGPTALRWGKPHVYDNGVTLIVGQPRPMPDAGNGTPWSAYLALDPETDFAAVMPVKATVRVTNNSAKIIDPSKATLHLYVDGTRINASCVDAICRVPQVGMWMERSATGTWMWWVPREFADDVTIEATAGPDHEPVAWAGAVRPER
jgi:hypothetical protein